MRAHLAEAQTRYANASAHREKCDAAERKAWGPDARRKRVQPRDPEGWEKASRTLAFAVRDEIAALTAFQNARAAVEAAEAVA